jgi:hypothetical protein
MTEVERQVAITTIDNPYSPFTQWQEWNRFDVAQGYHSSAFLARLTQDTELLGETIHQSTVEQAIDEMIMHNLLGLWIKAVRVGDKETRTSKPFEV